MKPITKSEKLVWLPSLLAASLALSACNDISQTNDSEVAATNTISDVVTGSAVTASDTTNAVSATAEQTMIDNLPRYRWTLATAMDNNNQPLSTLMAIKDQVTLNFNQHQGQNSISYSVGCNTMGAAYQLEDQKLSIDESMSTKMSCGDLDIVENRLNELMQGDSELSLVVGEGTELTQVTSDGVTLVWTGKMTPQAKYKGKATTVFWAVSANTKPCVDNNGQMCLQVKPVTYDEQGRKVDEGEVVEFAGTIDGYEHDNTQDQVLRLQRFKTEADTVLVDNIDSEYAYVLDTVIETSAIK
ncbi:META and DUF4377 domain-containing protein [Psychrobacter sp. TAE2020]|uniref:META domain-containing protein n=1 Tax=Psychrobacter sp. TAE2020 TaxID=2846762 RepID=UPI001C0F7EB1|nr:META domain-containing protein [Psychrobacter sp. TAE2020]MBU5616416.1 META and DUF4377 domain-containing protein [Psychrobacter sp. TAE2020]